MSTPLPGPKLNNPWARQIREAQEKIERLESYIADLELMVKQSATAAPEPDIDSLVFAFMAGQMNPDKSPTYSNARIWVEEYLRNAGGDE